MTEKRSGVDGSRSVDLRPGGPVEGWTAVSTAPGVRLTRTTTGRRCHPRAPPWECLPPNAGGAQSFDDLTAAESGRDEKGWLPGIAASAKVRPGRTQNTDDARSLVPGRPVQRRAPDIVANAPVRKRLVQQVKNQDSLLCHHSSSVAH